MQECSFYVASHPKRHRGLSGHDLNMSAKLHQRSASSSEFAEGQLIDLSGNAFSAFACAAVMAAFFCQYSRAPLPAERGQLAPPPTSAAGEVGSLEEQGESEDPHEEDAEVECCADLSSVSDA